MNKYLRAVALKLPLKKEFFCNTCVDVLSTFP